MLSSSAPNQTQRPRPGRVSRRRRGVVAEFYPYHSLRQLNAAKRLSMAVVTHALAVGTLTKELCSECGKGRAEAHHDDYAKPLDVRWLCRFHHRRRDAELREARWEEIKATKLTALPVAYLIRQARLQPVPFASGVSTQKNRRRSLVTKDSAIALVVQATVAVSEAMDAAAVNELHLARLLRVSRQYINTQFHGGFRSLKMLASCADALGYDASFVLRKRGVDSLRNVESVLPVTAFKCLGQFGSLPSQLDQPLQPIR